MNTLDITAIPALNDNYIWLVRHGQHALLIDPGEAEPVLDYLRAHHLSPTQIWVTHQHGDHIGGIAELQRHYPDCRVFGADNIALADEIVRDGSQMGWQGFHAEAWHTAGHTAEHICYLLHGGRHSHFFCGDTLFSAGCGRIFPHSRAEWLFQSFQRIRTLADDTLLHPAHEYTAANLRFAQYIEPDNPDIAAAAEKAACTPTLPVSLAHEKRINPFLRVHLPQVRQRAEALCGRALPSDEAVFVALRELKNTFA